jgi:hypothetical protein
MDINIGENDHDMDSDDGRLNHDIGLASFENHHDETAEMMDAQMKKIKSKHSMNMSSGEDE